MKVIPDNGQSSANTSRKSNKTRTEENGAKNADLFTEIKGPKHEQ